VKVVPWRYGSGLIAFPAQVISLFLVYHGAGEAVGDLYRRLLPPAGRRPGRRPGRARQGARLFGFLLLGVPVAMAMSAAALITIVAAVRMVYHPIWALSATPAQLRGTWGGPTALGTIAGYWLAGALAIAVSDLVLRGGGYLLRRLVFPPSPEDQPAPFRRPASTRRSSGPVGPRGIARPR